MLVMSIALLLVYYGFVSACRLRPGVSGMVFIATLSEYRYGLLGLLILLPVL